MLTDLGSGAIFARVSYEDWPLGFRRHVGSVLPGFSGACHRLVSRDSAKPDAPKIRAIMSAAYEGVLMGPLARG